MERGLAGSRQRARELIEEGAVSVDGIVATRVATQVRPDQTLALVRSDHVWVGRGALKLLGVWDTLDVHAEGLVCADLGASTGGFTEVLLHHGARRVYAVDVGHNQLAWKLRSDPRVEVMEGVNARHLTSLPEPIDLVVGDLSFISLSLILPAIAALTHPGSRVVVLVKPQFEAGREAIASGGVVRDEAARAAAIARVRYEADAAGFEVLGGADSTVAGARSGNVEHFLSLRRRDLTAPAPG